ncbi:MAG: DUF1552 domain-containing protein [Steroidobacteraceae bacterium]
MHFLKHQALSRRAVLRGVGAALALPLLETMVSGKAQAAAAKQRRFGAIYVPHGAVMDRWMPSTAGTGFEFPYTLKPLEPFRDHLNVVSGLELPLAYGNDASAGANHTRSSAVYLTGAKPGTGSEAELGISVDQVIAKAIGQGCPLPSLELSIEDGSLSCGSGLSCAYRNTISWQGPKSPLPMENNPQVVFERLFGDGSTGEERTARRTQAKSLLDSVLAQSQRLQTRVSAGDRARLDRYFTDIREIERRIELAAKQTPSNLDVPIAPTGIPEAFGTHVKLMFDLLVLAWQADITRVSTLMFAQEVSNAVFSESGIREPFHNLSHHSNVADNIAKLSQLNRYHIETLGYVVKKLATTPDGEGKLLDNSVLMYGSGMSNSNQHDHQPLPILLAGGAGGALRGGRHIKAAKGTPLSNLQLALLHALDVPAESFGDSQGTVEI